MAKRMSFDRVSDEYDTTRAMPPEMQKEVLDALIEVGDIVPHSRVLELGIGTGRIAGPLYEMAQSQYCGIDISMKMMRKIREKKHGRMGLVCGDVCALPFKTGSFDVVLAVHVLHLVSDWRYVLAETRRVLNGDGVIVVAGEASSKPDASRQLTSGIKPEVAQKLAPVIQKLDLKDRTLEGMKNMEEAVRELEKMGASVTLPPNIEHVMQLPLFIILKLFEDRTFSFLWEVPDQALSEALTEMRRIFEEHYGDLNENIPVTRKFDLVRAAF